jgi:hypothetical protein
VIPRCAGECLADRRASGSYFLADHPIGGPETAFWEIGPEVAFPPVEHYLAAWFTAPAYQRALFESLRDSPDLQSIRFQRFMCHRHWRAVHDGIQNEVRPYRMGG